MLFEHIYGFKALEGKEPLRIARIVQEISDADWDLHIVNSISVVILVGTVLRNSGVAVGGGLTILIFR